MNNEKGLSLIELLVSITLLGILLVVFSNIYVAGIKVYQREFRRAKLQNENRIVLDNIVSDIKQSYQVQNSSTADSVILLIPSIDGNQDILYEPTGSFKLDAIYYSLSGNVIQKVIDPHADSSRQYKESDVIDKVTTLDFTYNPDVNSTTQMEINLVTTDTSGKETVTVNNTSKALLRNK